MNSELLRKIARRRMEEDAQRKNNDMADLASGFAGLAPGAGTAAGMAIGAGLGMAGGPLAGLTVPVAAGLGGAIGGVSGQGIGMLADGWAQGEYDKQREEDMKRLARSQAIQELLLGGHR